MADIKVGVYFWKLEVNNKLKYPTLYNLPLPVVTDVEISKVCPRIYLPPISCYALPIEMVTTEF